MSEQATTPFSKRCEILGELWITYRNDKDFRDFIEYNDIGLPVAYAISNAIVESTTVSEAFINETWNLLLESLEVDEDTGFDNVEDLLSGSEE
jgi:hypothetical protein